MSDASARLDPTSTIPFVEDRELLRRYAEDRSEEAFAELVRRRIDLVYSAALRRTDGDAHQAADVAQTVFVALAREASVVARHPVLTGWLYTATRNAALNVIRAERRRRIHEQEAHLMHELNSQSTHDVEWRRLRPVLDAAMDGLAERDREAVLMRFFEHRSFAEISRALNLSEDAARMRVERALEKLQALLGKHGVTSTASALGIALTHQAVATAPAGLGATVTGAALSGAIAVSSTGALAGLWHFMSASKTAVSFAAAGAVAIGIAVYQSGQALSAEAELGRARHDHAALSARLGALEDQMKAANLAGAPSSMMTASNVPVGAPNPTNDRAAQQRALQQFLSGNAELQFLQQESARARYKATNALLLQSIGLTAEQVNEAAEINAQNLTLVTQAAAGLIPEQVPDPNLSKFRARFGDEAADRWRSISTSGMWWATRTVKELAAAQYFTDAPFTSEQADKLAALLAYHDGQPKSRSGDRLHAIEWEKVLTSAEKFLSPAQLQSVQALAARGRNAALIAAEESKASDPRTR